MANANVNHVGQVNGAGALDALWLKVFSGEILTSFNEKNVMMDRHFVRTIKEGKSAQFPAIGKFTEAYYHTPGEEILGKNIKHGEVTISIDDLLIAPIFIADIEEAKNHYDVRSEYTKQIGAELARKFDKNVMRTAIKTARSGANVDGLPSGTQLQVADLSTDAAKLAAAMFDSAQRLDENDADDDRFALVRPAQFYLLVQNKDVLNKDWGGSGSYAKAQLPEVADIDIIKTNNLPNSDDTAAAEVPAKYQGDFRQTVGLVMSRNSVGTTKLLDLSMQSEWDIRRQGTLMVARYAVGHGGLRPESTIEWVDTSIPTA